MAQPSKEVKARYRENHREKIRAQAREYARRKRRAQGQARRGSVEWLAKRGPDHYVTGERHGNWRGDGAGYGALHRWLSLHYPKSGICSDCGKEGKTHYAFLHHPEPWTRDITDYIELCPPCHRKRDGHTEEARRKIAAASRSRPVSAETRLKLSISGKRGWAKRRAG